MGGFPIIKENFLDKKTCEILVRYSEEHSFLFEKNGYDTDFWKNRYINAFDIKEAGDIKNGRNIDIFNILLAKRFDVKLELINHLNNQKFLYSDTLQIVKWPEGYELTPHADSEEPDGSPHPYPYRDFATIIYLNDNYDGGEIYFPNLNLKQNELKPVAGTLIMFPGTLEYMHGVRPVHNGIRYTIASFMTYSREFDDGL